jgi:serine/threonine protein kinase
MIRSDGYVKVLDFGLAKLTKPLPGEDVPGVREPFFSTPGVIMGTSGYVSPEQARSGSIDARSDIFSMGVVLYEMLTGESPFAAESRADIMAAIVQTEPGPPGTINDEVPPKLDRIVIKMLQKERSERYQTAAELLDDLKSVRMRSDVSKAVLIYAARNQTLMYLAAVLILIAVVATVAIWLLN